MFEASPDTPIVNNWVGDTADTNTGDTTSPDRPCSRVSTTTLDRHAQTTRNICIYTKEFVYKSTLLYIVYYRALTRAFHILLPIFEAILTTTGSLLNFLSFIKINPASRSRLGHSVYLCGNHQYPGPTQHAIRCMEPYGFFHTLNSMLFPFFGSYGII